MTTPLSSASPVRRRLPRLPLVLWVAIAAVAYFSAGAVYWKSGTGSDSAGTWMKPAAAAAEYRAEARALDLAPGWRWPARLAFAPTGPDGARMRCETGFGSGQASIYWFSPWAATAASAHVSPADRARAVGRLDGIHRTPLF